MPENIGSNYISEVRWDDRGRPYRIYLMDVGTPGRPGFHKAGERSYVSPEEAKTISDPKLQQWAAQNQRPGASLLKTDGTWNSATGEHDRGFNWGNVATIGAGALTGTGIASALGAFGGAAPSAATPSAFGSSAPAAGLSYPGAAGLTNTAAIAPTTAVPAAIGSQGASSGYALPAMVSGGKGLLDQIKAPFTGQDGGKNLAGLAALIPLLTNLKDQSSNGPFGDSQALQDEIQRSLALQRQRTEQAQPVYDTLVRMAHGMSPAGYREVGATPTPYPYQAPRFR